MTIGERISVARKRRGFSQPELGRLCGWDTSAKQRISNYENGARTPRTPDLKLIASALDVSIEWLVFGEVEPVVTPANREEQKILSQWRKASEQTKKAVLATLAIEVGAHDPAEERSSSDPTEADLDKAAPKEEVMALTGIPAGDAEHAKSHEKTLIKAQEKSRAGDSLKVATDNRGDPRQRDLLDED